MNHAPTALISPFFFRSSNTESALQLDALFLSFALVTHSVKRSNHISIFGFAIDIRQFIHRFRSDGDNLGGIVQVDTLSLVETVNNILCCYVIPIFTTRLCPKQDIAVTCPYGFYLSRFLWALAINKRHLGLQGRIFPIVVAKSRSVVAYIIHHSLGIPQNSSLHIRHLIMQTEFCR